MRDKKFIVDNKELMSEWDFDKNSALGLFPETLSEGSHKKVWWKCVKSHSWDAVIKSRVSGNGCRFCAGQALTEYRKLSIRFPEIAKEWHPTENGKLTPNDVSYGQKLMVNWLCPKCGETYPCLISNRTSKNKRGCPFCCHNPKASPGYNLAVLFPDIAKEWHPTDNGSFSPKDVTPHSNKKIKWLCKNGHTYSSSVNNRLNGDGCPFCSGNQVCYDNSLAYLWPELAQEWDSILNTKQPTEITAYSNQLAHWICSKCGHKWKAKVDNRSNGRGCPKCVKGKHTSFPEQVVFYYIRKFFPDAENGYKLDKTEIDIFIPSLNVGIEYDGENYHKSLYKFKKDIEKNNLLYSNNIALIRIRESKCTQMYEDKCKIYICEYSIDYRGLKNVLERLLADLCNKAGISNCIDIEIDSIRNKILAELHYLPYEKSFAAIMKKNIIRARWDYEANYPLTPEMVRPMSDKYVYWICINDNNHKWEAPVKSISRGYGCNRCAGRHKYNTEEWIEQAMEVHGDKYDYSNVKYINSKTSVKIICTVHGVFEQLPSEHLSGKSCKWCKGQGGYHELNTLSFNFPELAKEWDYDHVGNNGLTPEDVLITDNTNYYWWRCNNRKPHSYKAKISFRIKRNSKCAVCRGKQVSYDTSFECLRPDLVKEWHFTNTYKPSEVSLGSEKKIIWKCPNPDHEPYSTSVYNRAHLNSGCPECSGNKKSHKTFENEVKARFPYIDLISTYQKSGTRIKCKCTLCGYIWNPLPFNLLKRKTGCPNCQ